MKTIYLIQIFHLTQGFISLGDFAFRSLDDAQHHISEMKRMYSEIDELSLEEIEKKYVFNILTFHLH